MASKALLNSTVPDRDVRHDATLDEELAASRAARLQPPLVKPQQIHVRRARGPFTHLAQHVDEVRPNYGAEY